LTQECPTPLTPTDADLTDFKFMPLQVARLRKSKAWLVCKRRPDLAFYMLNLWTAAWHERPAGSLEEDDDVLADLAMCSPEKWAKVRREVLRGWVKCSDGRLYHTVVAEVVIDAWKSKRVHAYDRECGRLRKALKRGGLKEVTEEMLPTFEEWDRADMSGGQFNVSAGKVTLSTGRPPDKFGTSNGSPEENALKGKGEGQSKGQGQGYISPEDEDVHRTRAQKPATTVIALTDAEHHSRFERVKAAYPKFTASVNWIIVENSCRQSVDQGATWADIESGARRFAEFVRDGGRSGPQYVDSPQKFFGAEMWKLPWDPPPTKSEKRLAGNLDAAEQAKRELMQEMGQ
jgi:hypothetical protein